MNEDLSLISIHPLVRRFVLNIVRDIQQKKYSYEAREVVHADMVPKFHEKVVQASMGERRVSPEVAGMQGSIVDLSPPQRVEVRRRDMSELVAPIKMRPRPQQPIVQVNAPQTAPVQRPVVPQVSAPSGPAVEAPQNSKLELTQDYGKIMPLLNDPSVSTIDCPGPDKPIFVIRAGQRQITKIQLNVLEIKGLLEKFAESAHVPLMEGVFRVSVDGLNVSAVISEMLGSKFVIKKATAYNLLE